MARSKRSRVTSTRRLHVILVSMGQRIAADMLRKVSSPPIATVPRTNGAIPGTTAVTWENAPQWNSEAREQLDNLY